ncbi:ATP-dependent DNA helicase II subunit 2 [Maudiozyma exigua]|uniref:ATP-dependent DNA helicase II subunit 2 n=1 Tax=Maudiozyma exigua TaxID=34358 RepID=A0A9P6VVC5_MAUEX|nr:ATP-dependent DNA helicase II subunit 2 [Kazachstania exigua]
MTAECTSFLVDVSQRMIETEKIPPILEYLEYTLLEKYEKGRKTDWINCYLNNLPRTEDTKDVEGVIELQTLSAPLEASDVIRIIKTIASLKSENVTSTDDFNTIEQCLILASLEIKKKFNKRSMIRQIMCFTDDLESINLNDSEIDEILDEYQGRFILVDCRSIDQIKEDDTNGVTGDDNSWFRLIKKRKGSFMVHISELTDTINSPIPSTVKPVRVFAGQLRLGADTYNIINQDDSISNDNITDPNCLCINVEGYPATKSVSSSHRKLMQEIKNEDGTIRYETPSSVVEYEIYPNPDSSVKTENLDDKKVKGVPVSKKGVTKAYRYGSDYITIPAMIANQFYYHSTPGLDIRGFMDEKDLPRRYLNSESVFILADTRVGNTGDIVGFSALVDSLISSKKVAICRYVQKTNSDIQMVVLIPLIISTENLKAVTNNDTIDPNSKGVRTLILNRLPFAEDERMTTTKRKMIPTIKNESGKVKKEEEGIDVEERLKQIDDLMSEFVDSMSLNDKPDTPPQLYYEHVDETPKVSSLPLPTRQTRSIYNSEDPLRMAAIGPFSNKQLLINAFNQINILEQNDISEFIPPNLSKSLQKKINPLDNGPRQINNDIEGLVSLLGIKKIEETKIKSDIQATADAVADFVSTEQAPPLDDILARGRRD